MLSRFSNVNHIKITSVAISSILQIGDSQLINGFSRALAVQREAEIFLGKEGDFSQFPIFPEAIPLPPINDNVISQKFDLQPYINVPQIYVNGVASASVVHIGNTCHINMEARVKHIRQIFKGDE